MFDALILGWHLQTAHVHGHYERQTVGIYVEDAGWTAGAYRNSLDRPSVYAGYTVGDALCLTAGVVTGYGRPQPLLVPSVVLPLVGAWRARLAVIPRPRGGSAAATLGVEYRW